MTTAEREDGDLQRGGRKLGLVKNGVQNVPGFSVGNYLFGDYQNCQYYSHSANYRALVHAGMAVDDTVFIHRRSSVHPKTALCPSKLQAAVSSILPP